MAQRADGPFVHSVSLAMRDAGIDEKQRTIGRQPGGWPWMAARTSRHASEASAVRGVSVPALLSAQTAYRDARDVALLEQGDVTDAQRCARDAVLTFVGRIARAMAGNVDTTVHPKPSRVIVATSR